MSELKVVLRPADIASKLGVSRARIYQLIAAGAIPATRVGDALWIPREAWERWLEQKSEQAFASARVRVGSRGRGRARREAASA